MKSKHLSISVAVLFLSSSVLAQTQKGNFVLLGKTSLNALFSTVTSKTDSVQTGQSKSNEYDFTAGGALFIADDLSFGATATYSYNYSKNQSQDYYQNRVRTQNITKAITLLPQLQYYFPVSGKLRPVVVAGVGYMWLNERDSRVAGNNNQVYSFAGPSFVGGAGASYFITNSISFDLGLQYSYSNLKDKLNSSLAQQAKQFAATMGVSVYF